MLCSMTMSCMCSYSNSKEVNNQHQKKLFMFLGRSHTCVKFEAILLDSYAFLVSQQAMPESPLRSRKAKAHHPDFNKNIMAFKTHVLKYHQEKLQQDILDIRILGSTLGVVISGKAYNALYYWFGIMILFDRLAGINSFHQDSDFLI